MKTYKIIVLGASGSGKTFFLASMFKKLSTQSDIIGFYLEAAPDQRKELIRKYTEISNPNMGWPPGTLRSEVSRWNFTCNIKSNLGKNYPIFNFTYIDYSGEIITESQQDSDDVVSTFMIEDEVKQSDALLVLLDGQKILNSMQNKEFSFGRLDSDLNNIFSIIQSVDPLPVHFVITKWDLLQKGGYSLKNVRDKLLKLGHFKNVYDQLKKLKMHTRLIPVSALGNEFVELGYDGMMTKIPNKIPKPFHVEMPLACVLIDKFKIIHEQLATEPNSTGFLFKRFFMELIMLLTSIIKWLPLPDAMVIGILMEFVKNGLERNERNLKEKEKVSLEKIYNKVDAVKSVVSSYGRLILKLEEHFPESKI